MFESTISRTSFPALDDLAAAVRKSDSFPTLVTIPWTTHPVEWLSAQVGERKLLWSNRSDESMIAGLDVAKEVVGHNGTTEAAILQQCRNVLKDHSQLKFYGGFSYSDTPTTEPDCWSQFGRARFWLPRIFCDGESIGCVVLDHDDKMLAEETIAKILPSRPLDSALPDVLHRSDSPCQSAWAEMIADALSLFENEVLEKIVLARKATFKCHQTLNAFQLFAKLCESTHACYHFCFQLNSNLAFLGASPERLFYRRNKRLLSEVVAGTRPRGISPDADALLSDELLHSGKDQLEHDIVRKFIRQRLHRFVDALEVDSQASILKLARKQHLYSGVRATLKSDVEDGDLMARLHPTPAVGGYPVENALTEIARLEPFSRGWYAAPVGWIGAREIEFAVAIRSGLIQDNCLSLYSGAGIVPGSTAEKEWEEIENKISDFLEVISNR